MPGFLPTITAVQIADDAPAWREYLGASGDGVPAESWLEEGTDIGTHASGFPADTVEDLYDECEAVVRLAQATEYQVDVVDGVPEGCRWFQGICEGDRCSKDQIDLLGFSCGSMAPAHVAGGSSPDAGGGD
jgi:hypothetical protein